MEPATLTFLVIIFVLACVVGYFVVWGVTPALHTPLMAVTNAISGIVIIAAMILAADPAPNADLCRILPCPAAGMVDVAYFIGLLMAFFAIVLCAINIFGGFTITRRMLSMYKAKDKK